MKRCGYRLVMAAALAINLTLTRPVQAQEPAWRAYDRAVFNEARQSKRLMLLSLEAVWCHWCHVMKETTYHDPAVLKLLEQHYIPIKVDSDARPDLANRYEDYGWPATIIFDSQGQELARLSGYIEPKEMAKILARLAKDPKPEVEQEEKPDLSRPGAFSLALVKEILQRHFEHYDYQLGGFGFTHKYLNWNSTEYALSRARQGDERSYKMAIQTLNAERALLDPVWGGVYQYSDSGVWTHPHYEKVLDHQTGDLRLYSLAYSQFGDPRYLKMAERISAYLQSFMTSPEGAFYTSQDADLTPGVHSAGYFALNDEQRRKRGIPTIDKHSYARENGWVIEALALYFSASNDRRALESALRAARWIEQNRRLPHGGYSHGPASAGDNLYLGDSLACGRAFLALYNATGERTWLSRAQETALFMESHFRPANSVGLMTCALSADTPLADPVFVRDEIISAYRFANTLARLEDPSGKIRKLADAALAYLAVPSVAREHNTGGVLLCEWESRHQPLAVTVVGPRGDALCQALFQAAGRAPTHYRTIDWWDPATEPASPNHPYPPQPTGVAYVCAQGQCIQVKTTQEMAKRLKQLKLP